MELDEVWQEEIWKADDEVYPDEKAKANFVLKGLRSVLLAEEILSWKGLVQTRYKLRRMIFVGVRGRLRVAETECEANPSLSGG
jgi:hypothetical protein